MAMDKILRIDMGADGGPKVTTNLWVSTPDWEAGP